MYRNGQNLCVNEQKMYEKMRKFMVGNANHPPKAERTSKLENCGREENKQVDSRLLRAKD